jgi:hypothetical protein
MAAMIVTLHRAEKLHKEYLLTFDLLKCRVISVSQIHASVVMLMLPAGRARVQRCSGQFSARCIVTVCRLVPDLLQ